MQSYYPHPHQPLLLLPGMMKSSICLFQWASAMGLNPPVPQQNQSARGPPIESGVTYTNPRQRSLV